MKKNNKNKLWIKLFIIILISIFNLAFLYYIKYHNQNLRLKEFNLHNFGNEINLACTIILITGLILDYYKKNFVIQKKDFLILFLLVQVFLIASYIFTIIPPPFRNEYWFGQNGSRLFVASLFSIYNFFYFVVIFIVWLSVVNTRDIMILRGMFNSSLLMLMILLIVFVYILKSEAGFSDKNIKFSPNNYGVVLGAAVWSNNKPSTSLLFRVNKAISLYEQRKISRIYLTGSNAPGELSESEVALNYIKSLDKNISDVRIEKKTTSTNEQIEFIRKQLSPQKNNIIVISDGYHLTRVLEISKFHNIKIKVVPSDLSLSFDRSLYNKFREALALTVFWFFAI